MSIADKLTYLNTTKQLLKTEINKINNVLTDESTFRSYPQELFNGYLDILNNGTDTLWSNLEKVSQTGTEAVLEGVETAPIKMVLNGNTIQDGTPTPDTPVEVKVVTGENVVSVSGKNLFNTDNLVQGYISNTIIDNRTSATRTNAILLKAGTYTYSFKYTNSVWAKIVKYDNSTATTGTFIFNLQSANYNRTFTLSEDTYVRFGFDTNLSNILANATIQLELGSTATPYVPYSKTDYPISLGTIEMCKIGDYKDYLYKNNGKWYVHKEIGKVVLNGSENWETQWSGSLFGYRCDITGILQTTSQDDLPYLYCDKYTSYTQVYVYNHGSYGICRRTNQPQIIIRNDDITKLANFKTWLSSNNVTLYYPLATPTEEEITNTTLIEQLEAISKAKSVKDKTYITQTNDDLPFILDVEAIKEYSVE